MVFSSYHRTNAKTDRKEKGKKKQQQKQERQKKAAKSKTISIDTSDKSNMSCCNNNITNSHI
jgi:hypothetical protein